MCICAWVGIKAVMKRIKLIQQAVHITSLMDKYYQHHEARKSHRTPEWEELYRNHVYIVDRFRLFDFSPLKLHIQINWNIRHKLRVNVSDSRAFRWGFWKWGCQMVSEIRTIRVSSRNTYVAPVMQAQHRTQMSDELITRATSAPPHPSPSLFRALVTIGESQ